MAETAPTTTGDRMPARAAVTVAGAAIALALLTGCQPDSSGGSSGALASELRETGVVLYLPELAGQLPAEVVDEVEPGVEDVTPASEPAAPSPPEQARPTEVAVEAGVVVVSYTSGGRHTYTLQQQPVPRGSLCTAVPQTAGSECTERAGVLRSTMEEMATVAVARGNTLLTLRGLVIEANPDLLEAAVEVLQEAPAISPEQLAAVSG